MWTGRLILFSDAEPGPRALKVQGTKSLQFDTRLIQYSLKYAFVRAMYEHLENQAGDTVTITEAVL